MATNAQAVAEYADALAELGPYPAKHIINSLTEMAGEAAVSAGPDRTVNAKAVVEVIWRRLQEVPRNCKVPVMCECCSCFLLARV